MEPEDCTIRYEQDQSYTNLISQKIAKIRNKSETNTNPFDAMDQSDNKEEEQNDNNSNKKPLTTNPFDSGNDEENIQSTNPFDQDMPTTKKTNSTNPFFTEDLP